MLEMSLVYLGILELLPSVPAEVESLILLIRLENTYVRLHRLERHPGQRFTNQNNAVGGI